MPHGVFDVEHSLGSSVMGKDHGMEIHGEGRVVWERNFLSLGTN